MPSAINVLAPAKVNLFLHVTGKQEDGYHTIQSHIMFADIGDNIIIESSNEYSLIVHGEFSDILESEDNLVTKAVKEFCTLINQKRNFKITLEKNIPVGAGLGGGSSDAAAAIRGLIDFFDFDPQPLTLSPLLEKLGADVPACFYGRSCLAEGIGEKISPLPCPALHAVLVYPNIHCSTAQIFQNFDGGFRARVQMKEKFSDVKEATSFLSQQANDLTQHTTSSYPEITTCLKAIEKQKDVLLSRMSGSGSSCFGIFKNAQDAADAAQKIKQEYPDWWVKNTVLS